MNATELLRPALLEGTSLLVACPPATSTPSAPFGAAVEQAFSALGARVATCLPDGEDEAAIDAALAGALAEVGAIDMLLVDGCGLFGNGAPTALRACLDAAWNVTRAVVNHAFLPAGRGGRIVYVTPAPDAGEQAMAARAGLENLARTLSVEWARHDINVIAIAPGRQGSVDRGGPGGAAPGGLGSGGLGPGGRGSHTSAQKLAALAAYLASPAGTYFSGCLLDLDTIP